MKEEAGAAQSTTSQTPKEQDKPLLLLDVPALLLQVKGEEHLQKNGRTAKTLYKSQTMRIVLNVMQAGTEIKQHQANGPISVQVLEGQLEFQTDEASVVLRQGEMLTLQEKVKHSVTATTDTAFLLTVAPLPA